MNAIRTTSLISIGLLALVVRQLKAAENPRPAPTMAEMRIAIDKGLTFLAAQQQPDGSFEVRGTKLSSTGLALMAFLADGRTAEGGKYGGVVRRAVDFLLRQTPGDRYFGRVDGSKMYGQAVVTLALCQAYGVEPDEQDRARLRATLKDAVNVLATSQNARKSSQRGGWSEDHGGTESDPIVTKWAVAALAAADAVGLDVPKETLNRAADYLSAWKQKGDAAAVQSHRLGDEQYFAGKEQDDSSSNTVSASTIASQKADGGWSAEESSDSPESIAATSLAELCITQKLRLTPAAD